MSAPFKTKKDIYAIAHSMRDVLGVTLSDYPLNVKTISQEAACVKIGHLSFKSNGLRGIAIPASTITDDNIIILNSLRDERAQNFDCAHELYHILCHRGCQTTFNCNDELFKQQNKFLEWQANEGGAEFVVPYQLFIPRYVSASKELARKNFSDIVVIGRLAEEYRVSEGVISNRINSLNFEIYNYMQGQDVFSEQFQLVSNNKLKQLNWNESHLKTYCRNCLSVVSEAHHYCTCCGINLYVTNSLRRWGAINKGAGYMKYSGIELSDNNRAKACPICGNDDIPVDSSYCMVCKTRVSNLCVTASYYDPDNMCGNHAPLPGYARYCPECGGKTTFFEDKLLHPWNQEEQKNAFSELDEGEPDLPF